MAFVSRAAGSKLSKVGPRSVTPRSLLSCLVRFEYCMYSGSRSVILCHAEIMDSESSNLSWQGRRCGDVTACSLHRNAAIAEFAIVKVIAALRSSDLVSARTWREVLNMLLRHVIEVVLVIEVAAES